MAGISIENGKKPWDRGRLFQRVNSPSFVPPGGSPPISDDSLTDTEDGLTRLNGRGHDQGTRRPADFDSGSGIDLARRQLIRTVPAWVKTAHPSDDLQTNERAVEQELYGHLKRSFQTWTDAPPFQWHRWYDWNFHVEAAKEFDWLRGAGNFKHPPKEKPDPSDNQRKFPMVDTVRGDVMECEWDVGAFGLKPGPMFNDRDKGQASIDWAWPMAGDFVWLVGRSIYDGGHEDNELCRTELHPCKAMATARREAFTFPAVGHAVAATQFSFFASVLGGVVDFKSLKPKDGKNYEFLVDLPLRPDTFQPLQHPVGATSDFPFNRISLRRVEPIIHLDFTRHRNALGKQLSIEQLRATPPDITFERPEGEADEAKWQARIKIPFLELLQKHGEFETYGVVISLGWPDPTGDEGRKVKRVEVNFRDLQPHIFGPVNQIWRFKVGVNGRWFHWEREKVMNPTPVPRPRPLPPAFVRRPIPIPLSMDAPLTFFLHEDDVVRVSTHGAILGPVDGVHTGRTPSGTLGGNILGGFGTDDARTVMISPVQVAIEGGASALEIFPNEDFRDQSLILKIITVLETFALAPLDIVLLLLGLLGLNPRQLAALGTSRPVEWNRDVDVRPFAADGETHAVQRVVVKNQADMMVFTLGDENDPLALVDGDIGPGPDNTLAPPGMVGKNPMPVKGRNDPPPASPPPPPSVVLKGLATESNEALAELLEHAQVDNPPLSKTAKLGEDRDPVMYEFGYDVLVQDQFATENA